MEKKIKVLEIMESVGIGGTEKFVMNIYENIDLSKFQIDFLVFDSSKNQYLEYIELKGGKVFFYDKNEKKANYFRQIKYVKSILKTNDYDLVHCHAASLMGIIRGVVPAKQVKNIAIISHSHGIGDNKGKISEQVVKPILRKIISSDVDMGLACSDIAGTEKYVKSFIESPKFRIINNGISIDRYMYSEKLRSDLRNEYNISDNTMVIGTVARLSFEKNQAFLIEVVRLLVSDNIDVKLILVGDGEEKKQLVELTKKYNLENNVIFTGSRNDANIFYNMMDVFTLPSLYEGFPFVLVEAQLNGLPCISSNNMSKMVNITGNYKFLDIEKPEIWADYIKDNILRRTDDKKIQEISDLYDIKNVTKEIEQIYMKVVGGRL